MHKLWSFRSKLLLPTLACSCIVLAVCAPQTVPPADVPLAVLDQKHATHRLLTQLHPEYPPVARINYLQGSVQLQLSVDGSGRVADAHVTKGNAVLAASALKAVRTWSYRPLATAAGFRTSVVMRYSLKLPPKDLTPRQAEQDFLRQVKPPQVLRRQDHGNSGDIVHVRLLLDADGQVDDVESASLTGVRLEAARERLHRWKFRPARWGNLAVASYFEVDVPMGTQPLARAAATAGSR